jgi:hypothetical protein
MYFYFIGPGREAFWMGFLAVLVASLVVAPAAVSWSKSPAKRWTGIYRPALLLLILLFGLAGVAGLLLI